MVCERLMSITIDGLGPERQRLLSAALADALEPLSDEADEAIGAPAMALRH